MIICIIKTLISALLMRLGLVTMLLFLVFNHIFFLLKCKFFAEIIGHTINFCNIRLWKHSNNRLNVIIAHYKFNAFIAIFLIINNICESGVGNLI